MRDLLLLGASGNIGSQTLDVMEKDRSAFRLLGFSVGHHIEKIPSILARFPEVRSFCVQEESDYRLLKDRYRDKKIYWGEQDLCALIEDSAASMVVNALVGFAGVAPSLTALSCDKILALSNKESLVVAGPFLKAILNEGKGKLYPIDSEHVALAKCLSKVERSEVKRLILTASGGAFRSRTRKELENVDAKMALAHPTWHMGPKITIDCASMMNKGFELIEAHELFSFPYEEIEILLHDESEVHSLIELKDGHFLAEVGKPDMKGPIAYALYEGKDTSGLVRFCSFDVFPSLHFHPFDPARYPAVSLAKKAAAMPFGATAILNAADEVAVAAFLDGKIPFLAIDRLVEEALSLTYSSPKNLSELASLDKMARDYTRERIANL